MKGRSSRYGSLVPQTPGYIGRPATMIFGVLAIVLGAFGIGTAEALQVIRNICDRMKSVSFSCLGKLNNLFSLYSSSR
jgi:hypothetical protein